MIVCNWMFGVSSGWCLLTHTAGWPEERVLEGPSLACAVLLICNHMNRSVALRRASGLHCIYMSPSKHRKAPEKSDTGTSSLILLPMKQGKRGEFDHVCKIRVMAHRLSVGRKLLDIWDPWPKALWGSALHYLLCLWYRPHQDRSQLKAQNVVRSWKIKTNNNGRHYQRVS